MTYGSSGGMTCEVCHVYVEGASEPRCAMHKDSVFEMAADQLVGAMLKLASDPEVRLDAAVEGIPNLIEYLRNRPTGEMTLRRSAILAMLLDAVEAGRRELRPELERLRKSHEAVGRYLSDMGPCDDDEEGDGHCDSPDCIYCQLVRSPAGFRDPMDWKPENNSK